MSAKADTTMNKSLRIASHCVLSQSYPVFAYRLLADAAEPFMLIRVSVSRLSTLKHRQSSKNNQVCKQPARPCSETGLS